MATNEDVEAFWAKAEENLAGAASEYEHRRSEPYSEQHNFLPLLGQGSEQRWRPYT